MVVPQVVLTLDPGGQEYLVIQLAERLQRRGIRSPIIAISGGALIEDATRRGLETFDLAKKPGFDVSVLFRLARIMRRVRADVVHTHNFAPLIYGTLSGRVSGTPMINTRHGRAALATHRFIWSLTDRVVAVSEDARRELLKYNRIAPRKVSVVLNGVDVAAFAAPEVNPSQVRCDLGIAPDARVFGIVARLAPEKDHVTLLEAFRIVAAQGPSHLVIVGGGPLESALRRRAHELGVSQAVHFLGFRSDIPQLLRALDVFVLSSTMEGVSLTLLEAMAAGLPIVATHVGGNPEVVLDNETGLLVPPENATALAQAMITLLTDLERAKRFGAAGRERAIRVFDIDRMVNAYVDLYATVAG
jgi:sugar transferase (PEP-CTERM/EpsH1 system associated)